MTKLKQIQWQKVIDRCVYGEAVDAGNEDVDDLINSPEDAHELHLYSHSYGPGPGLPEEGELFQFLNGPEGTFKVVEATSDHSLHERWDDEMVNFDDCNYNCYSIECVERP